MSFLQIVGGEVDKQAWNTAISNYTLYMENRDKGDYQVYIWNYGTSGTSMHVNIAREVKEGDPAGQERRELLANRDFRIALSKAIDDERFQTEVRVIHQLNELMFAATWMYFVWVRQRDPDTYTGRWRDPKEEWQRSLRTIREAFESVQRDWPKLGEHVCLAQKHPFEGILDLCDRVEEKYLG